MSANDNPPNGHSGASGLGAPGVGVGVQQQPNHNMFQHINGHIGVNGNSHGPAQAVVAAQQQQQALANTHAVAAQQAALAAAHQILQAQMQQATAASSATTATSPGGASTSAGGPGALQLSHFQQAANALQMVGSGAGSGGSTSQQLLQNSTDANAAATLASGFHPSAHSHAAPSASGTSTPVLQANGTPAPGAPSVAFGQVPNNTAQTLQAPSHSGMAGATTFPGIVQNPAQAAALLAAAAALGMNVPSANPANYAAQAFALMLQQQQQQQSDHHQQQLLQPNIQMPQPVQQQPVPAQAQAPPQQQPHSPQGQQQQRVTPTPPLHQQNQMDQASTQQQVYVSQQQPTGSLPQSHSSLQPSPSAAIDPQKQSSSSQNATQSSKLSTVQPAQQPPKKRPSKSKKLPKSLAETGKRMPSNTNQQQPLNHINHATSPSPGPAPISAQAPNSSLSFNAPAQSFNHVTGAFQMPTPVAAALTQATAAQALHNSIATMAAQAQAQTQPVGVNVPGHGHVTHGHGHHVNAHAHGAQNSIAMAESNHNNLYSASLNPLVLSQMQTWKLDQLEGHVKLLRDTNQPVPNAVQVLLAEARKMEEKRAAKRIANRKSACTSRARKKALVAEMTRTNARLRRQAVILSLLPDLVIAIKVDGEITFCSAQVERVLHHKVDEMVGENISEVLTRPSRSALSGLISKLVAAEKAVLEDGNKEGDESGRSSNSGNTSGAAIVSEQSDQRFPPSVVNVKKNQDGGGNGRPNNTTVDGGSGTTISRSGTQSSLSNSDGAANLISNKGGKISGNSGDESSSSSDAKNLSKANEALNRNVRFHNEQLKIKKDAKKNGITHKDDVTGDFVTANNADARLSSLRLQVRSEEQEETATAKKSSPSNDEAMEDNASFESSDSLLAGVEDRRHQKRKRVENNASDDSGYRESADSDPSREDSASSTSDTSNGGRPRPLAPTCNICLIRANLTTIWCEVTSSIRTRSLDEDDPELATATANESSKEKRQKISPPNNVNDGQQPDQESVKIKELLLCLRPIRDGEERVSEDLRFIPKSQKNAQLTHITNDAKKVESNGSAVLPPPSGDVTTPNSSKYEEKKNGENISTNKHTTCSRPMKKRQMSLNGSDAGTNRHASTKKQAVERQGDDETEKSAVESLILMSGHQK